VWEPVAWSEEAKRRVERVLRPKYLGCFVEDWMRRAVLPAGYGWEDFGTDLEIDHVKPRANVSDPAELWHWRNLRVVLRSVNRRKGTKYLGNY
jgi:5-methylcytosine-specific restriction endonuclease McrA